jgi:ABC-2 type transport system ATP-binding protein
MKIIDTHSLTLHYGNQTAVNQLTLAVESGESFALVGPNGAGKTTTVKMLTTLLPPSSGTACVAGYDVLNQAAEVRRSIGYVPQLISADGTLTAYENLLIFAKLYGVPRKEREARIQYALAFMGLNESANRLVREYSGGMIRRLEVAQSMLHRPRVLFLDEPTGGLDPLARETVWQRISELRREHNTTIFFTTHLMEEAEQWCTRIAFLHLGRLVACDTPAALKASLGTPDATLHDVFIHYAGGTLEFGANYDETVRARRVARRLG